MSAGSFGSRGRIRRRRAPLVGLVLASVLLVHLLLAVLDPGRIRAADTDPFSIDYQGGATASCGTTFDVSGGVYPAEPGAYPVVIFTPGTTMNHKGADARKIVDYLARRGFVAATADYDNENFEGCSTFRQKAGCLYGDTGTTAVSNLCALPGADCSKGILVAGFSQGSVMAALANNHDSRIRAAYGMGISTDYGLGGSTPCVAASNRTLPGDRIRAVNGESDGVATTDASHLNEVTGLSCASGDTDCWRPNRSGWRMALDGEVVSGESADHCYMRTGGNSFSGGCGDNLDANWRDGVDSWTMSTNLNWLATFADLPTLIVDDDGRADPASLDCSASGASDTAFTSVQEAVRRMPAPRIDNRAGTVAVCPGTYQENIVVDTSGINLTSVGDSTNTVLTASDSARPALQVLNAQDVRVEDLGFEDGTLQLSGTRDVTVRGSRLATSDTALHLLAADTNTIEDNVFVGRAWSPGDGFTGDSRAIQLNRASRNLIQGNRISGYNGGVAFVGSSDTNVVRENHIDTNWTGVYLKLAPGGEPRDNEVRRNTIRASNTGILIQGEAGGAGITNRARHNDILGNFEGVENQTLRIFDARENWWGAMSGPRGGAVDPFTGTVADGAGDTITWVAASGAVAADTNVAFDTWSQSANVGGGMLGPVTKGCVIERTTPRAWLETIRKLRDRMMKTVAGRIITRTYYRLH